MDIVKSNCSLHIEVLLKDNIRLPTQKEVDDVKEILIKYVKTLDDILEKENFDINGLQGAEIVQSILVEKDKIKNSSATITEQELESAIFHFYQAKHTLEDGYESFEDQSGGDNDDGAQPAFKHCILPLKCFVDLWSNLKFEEDVKEKLLRHSLCSLMLKRHNLNQVKITCNNLIILYGPPGTGKTSLCKALAQKVAIRQQDHYRYTHLIEINSHSLFSKWFSESGKLVVRLFNCIRELIADPKNLVIVLIDEVESIAYERNTLSGQEPKDAMRVVNAFLTELDQIKKYSNILILATSNLENSIDSAFLDRADLKIKINLPPLNARYLIFKGILEELLNKKIFESPVEDDEQLLSFIDTHAKRLAIASEGLNGRLIRKIPFLALSEMAMEGHLNQFRGFIDEAEKIIIDHLK